MINKKRIETFKQLAKKIEKTEEQEFKRERKIVEKRIEDWLEKTLNKYEKTLREGNLSARYRDLSLEKPRSFNHVGALGAVVSEAFDEKLKSFLKYHILYPSSRPGSHPNLPESCYGIEIVGVK